jgi:hypothetical protein
LFICCDRHPGRVGNGIARWHTQTFVAVSELWSHYAAAVHKVNCRVVDSTERTAFEGTAYMDLPLVVHGLSAMALRSYRRTTFDSRFVGNGFDGGMVAVATIRLATDLAIPGWATYVLGILRDHDANVSWFWV